MKKLILIFILAVITTFSTFGQCETRKYISSAQKIFDHKLSSSDFSNEILFLTIDTIDASNPNQNSEYREYTSSKIVLKDFYQIFDLLKKEGSFFNYYEFINYSLYPSPLHQSFLVNTKTDTYKIDIWNNKDNIFKIDGLTIQKLEKKVERTIY
jgi:hypothetical protein